MQQIYASVQFGIVILSAILNNWSLLKWTCMVSSKITLVAYGLDFNVLKEVDEQYKACCGC